MRNRCGGAAMERIYLALVLAAVLISQDTHADGVMVFGDSQSFVVQDTGNARKNWPYLLQEFTGHHFFNLSRGGRKLSDGHVADYLRLADIHRLNQQASVLMIALGSLDALWGTDPAPALMDAIQEAESREMRVVCLLPPNNGVWDTSAMRETIKALCPNNIDMSLFVGPDVMSDGVHLSEEGHQRYAMGVGWSVVTQGLLWE